MNKIDWNKPLRTHANKYTARVIGNDLESKYPYAVAIKVTCPHNEEIVMQFDCEGRTKKRDFSNHDLENIPEEHTGYVNIYKDMTVGSILHRTRDRADEAAGNPAEDRVRLSCKKITIREGEYDE